jgi:hypothetical protein
MAYRLNDERFAVDLPAEPGLPLVMGMTGREVPVSFSPTEAEWKVLMLLGWHARGLPVTVSKQMAAVLGGGWIRIGDEQLVAVARALARSLAEIGIPLVEIYAAGHCRLSMPADLMYFAPENFQYSWRTDDDRKCILVTLRPRQFGWAYLGGSSQLMTLAPKVARDLYAIEAGRDVQGDFERAARAHFEPTRALGLRKFTRAAKGTFEILVPTE